MLFNFPGSFTGSFNGVVTDAEDLVITVKNTQATTILKGQTLHAVGVTGENLDVITASADLASSMPAIGIANENIASSAAGQAVISGRIIGVNTDGLTPGDNVYINTNGGYTQTKPTGTSLIQNIGVVAKANSTEGEIIVMGAGRTNDLPNLTAGYIWVGNENGVPLAIASSSLGSGFPFTGSASISGSLLVTGSSTLAVRVSGSTALTGSLLVSGSTTLSGSVLIATSSIVQDNNLPGVLSYNTSSGVVSYTTGSLGGGGGGGPFVQTGSFYATSNDIQITGSLSATSITETSALRYKKDIEVMDSQLDIIYSLRPVDFTWRESDEEDKGFIAEEVQLLYPEFVTLNDDGTTQGIKYSKLVSVLVKSVQELKDEIELLKTQVNG